MKSLGSIRQGFRALDRSRAKPYIGFENVTKRFGDFTAVDNLSLTIYRARVLRAARPVRLRQDDAAAHARRLRGADLRPHPARRPGSARHPALPAAGQHDVPVLRAVPAHDGREQHRLRPQAGRHAEARDRDARRRDAEAGQARRSSPSASRTSSPAASASAWRWPARSPSGRRCCCSTSRSARSTRSCARKRSSS